MNSKPRILVVDDEPTIRRILTMAFDKVGYETHAAEDVRVAIQKLEEYSFSLILTDVTMPGASGYDLLKHVRENYPDTNVVIMTAFGTIPQAIQAIRDGAHEYITKPFDLDHLKKVVAGALRSPKTKEKKAKSSSSVPEGEPFLAESSGMKEVAELVKQVADSRATVMIGGESGVGKEVVARSLHKLSSRSSKSFVAVSCAAIPESLMEAELFGHEKGAFTGAQAAKAGKFELASGGTLFLDEIGEVPMSIQVKLLRVLQEREVERLGATKPTKVDVRLVTATNRDLREMVGAGSFRLDLLYRLQVVEINVPSLRDRLNDILPLANLFLQKFGSENDRAPLVVGAEATKALLSYSWPGNVRELENAMERATVLASPAESELTLKLLPHPMLKVA